ncbi:SUKH-4 family immunity protein [Micromonospora sp. CB01531]|uniref:SUKH-4 family immunity protein n=1 Tax=Micromonospora sp. CB01531 TaxID=1718947 RepID=UPI000B20608C|nr:SUKH-4 family immunity protein [Micromonospora sp. CB01531]
MTTDNFRYSAGYVERVRELATREFLVEVGLPVMHVLFMARETSGRSAVLRLANRELLRIGEASDSDDVGAYYVDCATGAVKFVVANESTELHVNDSPELLADYLAVFDLKNEVGAQGPGQPDPEEIAQALEDEIPRIDPSALADEPGFWRSLIDDVAIGDYTDDGSIS